MSDTTTAPDAAETFAVPAPDHAHDLDGYPTLDLDVDLIKLLVEKLSTHCGYSLGAKVPNLDMDSNKIHLCDCSGLARYLIYRATSGKVTIPDGSQVQLEWFADKGFKKSDYDSCSLRDGHVRINFHKCNAADKIGHVTIAIDGVSYESWSHNGPGTRPVNTPVLERLMNHTFVLK